jgi:hypothetical protein
MSQKRSPKGRSPKGRSKKVTISDIKPKISEETTEVKSYKMEKFTYVFLCLTMFFIGLYVMAAIFDDIYNDDIEGTTRSTVFICNAVAGFLALLLLLLVHYNLPLSRIGFLVRLALALGLGATVVVSATQMKNLLSDDTTTRTSEETTQFVLSVLGVFFGGISSLFIIVEMFMRRYS